MADTWYDDYWAALKAVIHQAWPEVPGGQLFADTAVERKDWQNLLNSNELVGPWVVIKTEIAPSDDGPPDWPCYRVTATVHYLSPVTAATAPQTITAYLAGKVSGLAAALLSAGTLGTVLTDMTLPVNAEEPANVSFLDAKLPYQAAALTADCIFVVDY